MGVRELYNKVKSLDIERCKEQAVEENKDLLVKLNQSQLRFGRTFKDRNIEPRYSAAYLKRKQKLSSYIAPDGIPDLYLHGDFYGGMDVAVESGEYDIISWDEKSQFLHARYDDLLGLTDENIEKAKVIVTKRFCELVKDNLMN